MKLPCYHTVHYKGFAIHYMNGLYKVPELLSLSFFDMSAAKARVDEYEEEQLKKINPIPEIPKQLSEPKN